MMQLCIEMRQRVCEGKKLGGSYPQMLSVVMDPNMLQRLIIFKV